MWLWVYYNKIPMYPIFYLLKGDCSLQSLGCSCSSYMLAWGGVFCSTCALRPSTASLRKLLDFSKHVSSPKLVCTLKNPCVPTEASKTTAPEEGDHPEFHVGLGKRVNPILKTVRGLRSRV